MNPSIQRQAAYRAAVADRVQPVQAHGVTDEAEDAARRNCFATPPEADSRLDNDETQVRAVIWRQGVRRPTVLSGTRQADGHSLHHAMDQQSDEAMAASVAGSSAGSGTEGRGGQSGGHHEGDRRGAQSDVLSARDFQHSRTEVADGRVNTLRELAMNVRGLPDKEAAHRLAAELAHCMLGFVNDAESQGRVRDAWSQLKEMQALMRLMDECRLPLRTTLPGIKAALLAANAAPVPAWQRTEAGDRARLLLPLILMQASAQHNHYVQNLHGALR